MLVALASEGNSSAITLDLRMATEGDVAALVVGWAQLQIQTKAACTTASSQAVVERCCIYLYVCGMCRTRAHSLSLSLQNIVLGYRERARGRGGVGGWGQLCDCECV